MDLTQLLVEAQLYFSGGTAEGLWPCLHYPIKRLAKNRNICTSNTLHHLYTLLLHDF